MHTIAIVLFTVLIIFLLTITAGLLAGAKSEAKLNGEYNNSDIQFISVFAFMDGISICLMLLYIYK